MLRDLPKNFFNDRADLRNVMQSLCSKRLKVENNEDLLISVLINQLTSRHFFKINDGASNYNNGADNLMMEHFNSTMEQLHHKSLREIPGA